MFNRVPFGRSPFNRSSSVDVLLSVTLHGEGGLTAAPSVEYSLSATLHGEGYLTADMLREIYFTTKLDGEGSLTADMIREVLMKVALHGQGTLRANMSRYHVDTVEITGLFKPGDRIIIDSQKLTVRKNGANAFHEMHGDFFKLSLGANEFTYTDNVADRQVIIRITHRDKYLY